MLLMIQCQKSIRFAPQNLHAIFAERNWKKSFSGCINYFKSNPKIRWDSAINGKYGSTKHETWIEQYLLNCIVQFRSQYLYDVASDFFLLFLKMNYLWFMRIFPIFHPIRKSQNLYDVASEFFYDFWKWTICDLWEYFQSAISTVCNPTSWNFWPQFQMGFVYICQEWLSKIGAAHMCSMDQGSLNTTVSWQ